MGTTRDALLVKVGMEGVPGFVADAKAVARANAEVKASAAAASGTSGLAAASLGANRMAGLSPEAQAIWSNAIAKGNANAIAAEEQAAAQAAAGRSRSRRPTGLVEGAEATRAGALLGIGQGAGGLAGLAAGFTVFSQLKSGIKYAEDSARVQAQVAQAIKQTGGAAHVSSEQVETLSKKLAFMAGVQKVDDVKNAEKVLLGYTAIANRAGRGNDIFNRASLEVQNMAIRTGIDSGQVALQLGKALQSPIRNLSNLRREGVLFTAGQEDQIKVMVASGNTLGAQKIILKQVEAQYGGAAKAAGKTLPGALGRLDQAWEDSRQKLILRMMPAATRWTNWLALTLPGAVDKAVTALSIFSRGQDNVVSRALHSKNGTLGSVFDYINSKGLVDMAGDANRSIGFGLNDVFGSNLVGPAKVQAALRLKAHLAAGGLTASDSADATALFGEGKWPSGIGRDVRGMGGTAVATPVKVNWDANVDPLANRPVVLIADGKVLAQVAVKGMAKAAHAQGRGSAHR